VTTGHTRSSYAAHTVGLTLVLRQTQAGEGLRQVRSGAVEVAIVDDWNGRLLAAVGVAPPVLSEFEGMSAIVSLVARGMGIAILPRLAAKPMSPQGTQGHQRPQATRRPLGARGRA
jgi:DNA-binding transcriptional LysR family regulator